MDKGDRRIMPRGVYVRTEEHNKKISKALKNKKKSDSHKKKLSESIKNLWADDGSVYHTEEYKEKCKIPCSEELKEHLRIVNKGINTREAHGLWTGGCHDYCHRKAWEMFGKDHCEICGISNDEHKQQFGCRLHMHCNGDFQILTDDNWNTFCNTCHQNYHKEIIE